MARAFYNPKFEEFAKKYQKKRLSIAYDRIIGDFDTPDEVRKSFQQENDVISVICEFTGKKSVVSVTRRRRKTTYYFQSNDDEGEYSDGKNSGQVKRIPKFDFVSGEFFSPNLDTSEFTDKILDTGCDYRN